VGIITKFLAFAGALRLSDDTYEAFQNALRSDLPIYPKNQHHSIFHFS
jgi:hypothetical protein